MEKKKRENPTAIQKIKDDKNKETISSSSFTTEIQKYEQGYKDFHKILIFFKK
jgi:hypothetical protein